MESAFEYRIQEKATRCTINTNSFAVCSYLLYVVIETTLYLPMLDSTVQKHFCPVLMNSKIIYALEQNILDVSVAAKIKGIKDEM